MKINEIVNLSTVLRSFTLHIANERILESRLKGLMQTYECQQKSPAMVTKFSISRNFNSKIIGKKGGYIKDLPGSCLYTSVKAGSDCIQISRMEDSCAQIMPSRQSIASIEPISQSFKNHLVPVRDKQLFSSSSRNYKLFKRFPTIRNAED